LASGIVEPSSQDSQGSGSEQAAGAVSRHSKLVERLLNASSALPAFIHDLLTTQAIVVAATEAAAFLLEKGEDGSGLRPVSHIRPENSDPNTRAAALNAFKQIVNACVAQGRDGAIEINANETEIGTIPPAEPQFCLITILRQDGNPVAVSAVITRCLNAERARQRLVAMQIVAGYFELYTLKRNAEQAQIIAQSHQHVLQLATSVATSQGFDAAGMSLCNELASRTKAVRVTLGWIKGDVVKVVAFSHTEQFDKKQELVVELQKVMEECIDQDEPVHYVPAGSIGPDGKETPAASSANVTRAAAAFSRTQGGNAILSLPMRRHSEIVGVIVLEFAPNAQLAPHAMASLTVAVDLLAPQLFDRYQNDRWLITKAGLSIRDLAEAAVGPQHMLAKIISTTVLAVILFVCLVKVEYHVTAPFQFAPVDKTTISSPIEAPIEQVFVRPGPQTIRKGTPLVKFKTIELEKKYHQAHSQALGYQAEANADLEAAHTDPTKAGEAAVATFRQLQAEAEAELDAYEISQATVVAPADGILLTGDLEDKVNSMVKQGDELFTFQSSEKLRAELSVAENDIQEVSKDQDGMLATTSLPSMKYPFTIERIEPMGQPKEGANIFKVFATLKETKPEWKPGMEGEAKINIQKRTIAWIWTHKFIDWLRLKTWTWM
jgi:hypothetical protein